MCPAGTRVPGPRRAGPGSSSQIVSGCSRGFWTRSFESHQFCSVVTFFFWEKGPWGPCSCAIFVFPFSFFGDENSMAGCRLEDIKMWDVDLSGVVILRKNYLLPREFDGGSSPPRPRPPRPNPPREWPPRPKRPMPELPIAGSASGREPINNWVLEYEAKLPLLSSGSSEVRGREVESSGTPAADSSKGAKAGAVFQLASELPARGTCGTPRSADCAIEEDRGLSNSGVGE